jgi:hypothetical protein
MAQIILRPTGAGAETNIPTQFPTTTYHWDKVDEATADDATTYVASQNSTSYVRDLYALATTSQAGTINWVRVYIRVYALAGYAKTALKSGTTVYDGAPQTLPQEVWTEYYTEYATMDGVAWTWAKVNAAQSGVSLAGTGDKGSGGQCTQSWLVVDYTETGLTLSPSSISQTVSYGTPKLNLSLKPSSIAQAIAYGSPKLNLSLKPSSIVQAVVYGTPTVIFSCCTLYPSSIVQPLVIGTPSLKYGQTVSPSSIVVSVTYGTPTVSAYGILRPSSIVQQISIGSPTLLKYVWHVVLDGQYATETPRINRAYVIGTDAYGNPVYGEAIDSTEIALVGERLDFQPDPAIPTTAQAAATASAVLSKMRLTGKGGVILIPPNCGQELFDVVQVSDSMANQAAVTFRVVGIRFEYNPKLARYAHKLILGAP